jgi:S1-C subfamily serine protease
MRSLNRFSAFRRDIPRYVQAAALGALILAMSAPASAREVAKRGELTPDERVTIDVFEKSKGSVVYISTLQQVRQLLSRNVRTIPRGTGSGFIWDEQDHIVTNYHVIAGASGARIRLNDGRDYPATLVGASPFHDVAVLRITVPSNSPPPLPLGSSGDLRVGHRVYAIGNPFGLDWTLTTGIVSALDRSLDGENGTIEHLIQTDAAINPGNSGGPLLDSSGRLIGMNTAIYSPSGASAGIGFAVPIDTINRVVPVLIATGRYYRPVLGIGMDDSVNDVLSARNKVEGVFVLKVVPDGPAAVAGLRPATTQRNGSITPGDVIVSIEGKPVSSVARLEARLDDFAPGDKISVGILREGKQILVDTILVPGK